MRYFTLNELTKSATASRNGIRNEPSLEETRCLNALVDNCLDPLRSLFGSAIRVTSAFRCKALNKAVGGSSTSQHLKGMAADIQAVNGANGRLFNLARMTLEFDQLIWEKGDDKNPSWIHVSYDPYKTKQRRQVLRTKNGKNYYAI